jgi:hypothetical protein
LDLKNNKISNAILNKFFINEMTLKWRGNLPSSDRTAMYLQNFRCKSSAFCLQ